jgi:hypothetical protein
MAKDATPEEIKTAESTFGVWKLHRDTLIVSYLDDQHVQMSNSKGEIFSITTRDWLERWDSIRDAGWFHYSTTTVQTYQNGDKTRTVFFDSDGMITIAMDKETFRTTYVGWQEIKRGWLVFGWNQVQ